MNRLTACEVEQVALLLNFFGELKLLTGSNQLRLTFTSRRKEAIVKLAELLGEYHIERGDTYMVRLSQADTHRLYEWMWPHLTSHRQFEFNAMIERQTVILHERVQAKRERERRAAEAARRATPSYEERVAMAEKRYDNSDPAVQVIEFLDPAMAIEAELAEMAAYRAAELKEQQRQMTQGQITSLERNAPKREKRKYTRRK